MNDAEANDMADKLAIRMVGIVADMIASDKRLASSIAAILDEKIGKRLAEIEMTMGLIGSDCDDDSLYSDFKRAIFIKCKSSSGISIGEIFSEDIRVITTKIADKGSNEVQLREIEHTALEEMISAGDLEKISNGKYLYVYKSKDRTDIF